MPNSLLNSQMPVPISSFYPTNKCKVQPVLVTTDLNMFLNKNILESSKSEGKYLAWVWIFYFFINQNVFKLRPVLKTEKQNNKNPQTTDDLKNFKVGTTWNS